MAKNAPEKMLATMLENLPAKTGKTLAAWFSALDGKRFEKHGQIMKWLKTENGVTHGFANLIAQQYLARESGDTDLVSAQYAGAKEGLRPIYDAVLDAVRRFGDDVEVAPKKTYVSLRRSKQFALVQPSTKDRVDIGINLGDTEPTGRLEKSGSFNAMVSHRVRVHEKADVDKDVRRWLKRAYDLA